MSKDKQKEKKKHKVDVIAFGEAYFASMNQTQAYVDTHPKCTRESAWRNGSRLMRNAEVRAYIEEKIAERHMGANEVLTILANQARADIGRFIEVDDGHVYFDFGNPEAKAHLHLIKKIKTKRKREIILKRGTKEIAEEWEHEWVEVELHDAQAALVAIGRHFKLFTDKFETANTLNIVGLESVLDKVYGNKS